MKQRKDDIKADTIQMGIKWINMGGEKFGDCNPTNQSRRLHMSWQEYENE